MLSWLSGIGEAFVSILSFISSTITGILQVFALVGQSVAFLTTMFGFIPSVLLVFAVAGIGITVFFQLIGR